MGLHHLKSFIVQGVSLGFQFESYKNIRVRVASFQNAFIKVISKDRCIMKTTSCENIVEQNFCSNSYQFMLTCGSIFGWSCF